MIARIWHGWSTGESADAYERLVSEEVLPSIHGIEGVRRLRALPS